MGTHWQNFVNASRKLGVTQQNLDHPNIDVLLE
jgi:hypothetical protein